MSAFYDASGAIGRVINARIRAGQAMVEASDTVKQTPVSSVLLRQYAMQRWAAAVCRFDNACALERAIASAPRLPREA
jgi:hypothetical protein